MTKPAVILTAALAIMCGLWYAQSSYYATPAAPDLSSDSYKAYVAEHRDDHAKLCANEKLIREAFYVNAEMAHAFKSCEIFAGAELRTSAHAAPPVVYTPIIHSIDQSAALAAMAAHDAAKNAAANAPSPVGMDAWIAHNSKQQAK